MDAEVIAVLLHLGAGVDVGWRLNAIQSSRRDDDGTIDGSKSSQQSTNDAKWRGGGVEGRQRDEGQGHTNNNQTDYAEGGLDGDINNEDDDGNDGGGHDDENDGGGHNDGDHDGGCGGQGGHHVLMVPRHRQPILALLCDDKSRRRGGRYCLCR